jgi:F0F1-type ATP synthase membrane subunit a
MFNDNELLLNHSFICIIFLLIVLVNCLGSDFEITKIVSSAKRTGLARPAIVFGRSFIYNIKNKGPRMEPWGMPYLVGSHFE